jgi:hypothetical protein
MEKGVRRSVERAVKQLAENTKSAASRVNGAL